MMRAWTSRAAMGAALLLGIGCGGGQVASWEETTPTETTPASASEHDRLLAEGDAAWAERGTEARLTAAIEAWQGALRADRSDTVLWARLARAQYFLADGHMAFDPAREAETTAMYRAAVETAQQGLAILSPEFARTVGGQEDRVDERALALLGADAVPLLYWRSAGLGKWARRDGFATLLAYKDEIRATMSRCLELDREYIYAGPDRYFGAFYSVAPTYAGGDVARSREHFEYAISRHPGYFGTHVLFAVEYAVKAQDRALYERELQLVIDGDPNGIPDVAPENIVEQRKAREAMASVGDIFE